MNISLFWVVPYLALFISTICNHFRKPKELHGSRSPVLVLTVQQRLLVLTPSDMLQELMDH